MVKHPPRASAACGGQLLILLRCLASLSLQGREESERLPFGRSPNAPFPQPKGRWEDLSMASTLPPLCETEGREQRLGFFLKMASLFLFFLPCWWNLVEISHLAAGFPGHYTQQRKLWLTVALLELTRTKMWFARARSRNPRKTTICTQGRKRMWNWWDGLEGDGLC